MRRPAVALRALVPLLAVLFLLPVLASPWGRTGESAWRAFGQSKNPYKKSGSRSAYRHRIPLLDASGQEIDAQSTAPYSPRETCRPCHDVDLMESGFHSNPSALEQSHPPSGTIPTDTRGEPGFWIDSRTGTVLPISDRTAFSATDIGVDVESAFRRWGRHQVEPIASLEASEASTVGVDCLLCHLANRTYDYEARASAIEAGQFATAPSLGSGLAVKSEKPQESGAPALEYDPRKFDPHGRVFFDVVRSPLDDACLACHSELAVGSTSPPRWRHEADVHTAAGISCVDCHGSGADHHMLRGQEGELHPSGSSVAEASCRGCHLDGSASGRFTAPRPEHRGLPPLHLDVMSCTACHSGPGPRETTPSMAGGITYQTSRAHGLGLASQTRSDRTPPVIAGPIWHRGPDGVLRPYRRAYSSFWGWRDGQDIRPIELSQLRKPLRRAMRVRRSFAEDVAVDMDTFRAKVEAALVALGAVEGTAEADGRQPIYVTGDQAWSLDSDLALRVEDVGDRFAADWRLAHEVRPARQAWGTGGCKDCHAADAPLAARAWSVPILAPGDPTVRSQGESLRLDDSNWTRWNLAFQGRPLFKIALWVFLGLGTLGFLYTTVRLVVRRAVVDDELGGEKDSIDQDSVEKDSVEKDEAI